MSQGFGSDKLNRPSLSIVIPAFNEARRIRQTLLELSAFKDFPESTEIILVIEKSSDRTVDMAREIVGANSKFTIIANEVQRGKGFAVRTGMLQARGEIVIFMDLDLSTPLAEIRNFLEFLKTASNTDILIGSRQHPDSKIVKRQNPIRQSMGRIFNKFVQFMTFKGIKDTQCGFKAFRGHTVEPIFSRQTINGFAFDVEILMLAQAMKMKVAILPVSWINSSESKVRIVRDSIKMLYDILRIKKIVRRTMLAMPF